MKIITDQCWRIVHTIVEALGLFGRWLLHSDGVHLLLRRAQRVDVFGLYGRRRILLSIRVLRNLLLDWAFSYRLSLWTQIKVCSFYFSHPQTYFSRPLVKPKITIYYASGCSWVWVDTRTRRPYSLITQTRSFVGKVWSNLLYPHVICSNIELSFFFGVNWVFFARKCRD
jgi:hypothetical protein